MQFDFNLVAGGGQVIDVKGRFFKYRAGTGMIRIKLTDGAIIDLMPGQGVSNRQFDSVLITDRSGAANVGTVLAGDFEFRDERISGTVEVVDGGKSRTIANSAFMLSIVGGSNAGQNTHTELFNPAGSSKNVIVEAVTFSSEAEGFVYGFKHTAQLATFEAQGQSKKLGGANAAAAGYKTTNAGAIAATASLLGVHVGKNVSNTYTPKEPIIVPPGYGLVMMQNVLAVGLSTTYEWYEEPL